ncbi:MAG TPA: hypothetical protein VLL52_05840 [Anaerolineae bacterium]|nr:hypothetical protein [Anaerolineae bacterium]
MAKTCAMIIGFLVPHKCPNKPVGQCTQCNRPFCDEHLNFEANGLICTACLEGREQPIALAKTAQKFTDYDRDLFIPPSTNFDDDLDFGDDMFSDLS